MLLMFILGSVSAQNTSLNIKGIVRDAMGDPIVGATILQQGSTHGTISNKDGEFSLSVPDKSMLEISFIGYQTKIVKVTAQKREFNIVLEDDTQVLADYENAGFYYEQMLLYDETYRAGYGEYGMFLFRTGQKEAGQALWTEYKSKETMLDDTVSRNLRLWEKEMTKSEEKS